MDPQTTWNALLQAWGDRNWQDVSDLAEALLQWLSRGGFPPDTMGNRQLGADWNRELAMTMCRFALHRSGEMLDSPNQIPS